MYILKSEKSWPPTPYNKCIPGVTETLLSPPRRAQGLRSFTVAFSSSEHVSQFVKYYRFLYVPRSLRNKRLETTCLSKSSSSQDFFQWVVHECSFSQCGMRERLLWELGRHWENLVVPKIPRTATLLFFGHCCFRRLLCKLLGRLANNQRMKPTLKMTKQRETKRSSVFMTLLSHRANLPWSLHNLWTSCYMR